MAKWIHFQDSCAQQTAHWIENIWKKNKIKSKLESRREFAFISIHASTQTKIESLAAQIHTQTHTQIINCSA